MTDNTLAISLDMKKYRIRVHKAALHRIGDPEYIQFLVAPKPMIVGITPASQKSMNAVKITRSRMESEESVEVYSQPFLIRLYALAGLNPSDAYRVQGKVFPNHNLLAFYLRSTQRIEPQGGAYEERFLPTESRPGI